MAACLNSQSTNLGKAWRWSMIINIQKVKKVLSLRKKKRVRTVIHKFLKGQVQVKV